MDWFRRHSAADEADTMTTEQVPLLVQIAWVDREHRIAQADLRERDERCAAAVIATLQQHERALIEAARERDEAIRQHQQILGNYRAYVEKHQCPRDGRTIKD